MSSRTEPTGGEPDEPSTEVVLTLEAELLVEEGTEDAVVDAVIGAIDGIDAVGVEFAYASLDDDSRTDDISR